MGILEDFSRRKAQAETPEEIKAGWDEFFRKKKMVKDEKFYQKKVPKDPWDALALAGKILSAGKPSDEQSLIDSAIIAKYSIQSFLWGVFIAIAADASVPQEIRLMASEAASKNVGVYYAGLLMDEGMHFDKGWDKLQEGFASVNQTISELGISRENMTPWAS